MALFHIPLSQIKETQLLQLISAKAAEARDIDYKRQSYGAGDADHAEWLADVSSFANTAGGDIILGMEAKAGVPTKLIPLQIDIDQEILRLEQIARSNLQPRITHLEFQRVEIAAGGAVLVIRIQRSYNPPHRIVRNGKGQNRFWARSSAGKYEPNVEELRALFNLAPQLVDRIRDFRFDRIAKIAAQVLPVTLSDNACLVMHVVPYSAFDPGAALLPLAEVNKNPHPFAPMGSKGSQNWGINFDGVFITSNADRSSARQRAYVQVYRNGRLEAVASSITSGNRPESIPPSLTSSKVEWLVLTSLVRFLRGLQQLGVEPPFAVMISLLGVRDVHMNVGFSEGWPDEDEICVLNENQFHFTEVIVESVPASIQDAGRMLRPFIEQLANTAGRPTSSSFGPSGEYLKDLC